MFVIFVVFFPFAEGSLVFKGNNPGACSFADWRGEAGFFLLNQEIALKAQNDTVPASGKYRRGVCKSFGQ